MVFDGDGGGGVFGKRIKAERLAGGVVIRKVELGRGVAF